ncbi:protein PAIR1 isoform X2 [Miscanthus floridulus]|uniref:protein PAIR1 isoform X2 n=1 Tax=Miscanthus floridulus TaxID=154761 RepID=UPI00345922CB
MKLKINKACDLGSISVLPPRRTGGSGGAGGAGSSAAAVAAGSQQQQRSQPMSQQSFSQGVVGSGGASSLLHSQSQLSQASLDENLLSLHLASPARDQRFWLHDDSSKKIPSLPVSSASCVREESQLQLAKTSGNPVNRWNPSLPDGVVPTEDVERKFQHMASSVHKVGMVLDSVQNDVMQLNRAMKEAALDSGSIQQKLVVLDTLLQKNLKGQDDLKALVESNTKSISDQLTVLNSHSNKLDEISSTLSILPKQIETDLKQEQSDIIRIFRKDIEEIVRAVRSLNSKVDAIQMPTDQRCTTNGRPLMNQLPFDRNERPQVNQTTEVTRVSQTPVASLVNQTPAANGRNLVSQTPVANGKTLVSQTSVANGRSLMSQVPAANGKPLTKRTSVANGGSLMSQVPAANGKPPTNQIPAPKGRPMMRQKTAESGRPQMNQIPVASGWTYTNKIPTPEVHPAPLVCPAKAAADQVDDGKLKVLPQKLTGSRSRVTPKQEDAVGTKFSRAAATEKVVIFIDDSDDDSNVRASSCVILRSSGSGSLDAGAGEKECDLMKVGAEESQEILRRARKRRRREMQAIVACNCMPPEVG